MRQGQHSKKNRGRNRRQSNPGNRVFESNGPDVKIRGNASHVSEKYLALARDAQAAGDPIAAENYLQHAEHYLRIIAATQAQQQQNQPCAPDQRASSGDEARGNGAAQPRGRNRRNGEAPAEEAQAEAAEAAEPAEAAKANGSDPEPAAEEVRKPRRRNGAKKAAAEEAEAPEETSEEVVSDDPAPEAPEEQVSEAGQA